MATTTSMEATASILFSHLPTSPPSLPSLSKFPLSHRPSPSSIPLRISISALSNPLKYPICPSIFPSVRPNFELYSSVEEVALLESTEESLEGNQKRKLYVVNLPWSFSTDDLKNTFRECGTVREVELIRNKDGKNRGFAFVTMSSGDEAQAVIDKFDSKELSGRTLKVEYAKRLKKPRPQPPAAVPVKETRHKLYVSNLHWKVRSTHLRDFFSANFNPVSARVVFESAAGRSAGYGFVSFGTREEAEAAMSSLDGKELLGRPVRLKFSERTTDDQPDEKSNVEESVSGHEEEEVVEGQPDKS